MSDSPSLWSLVRPLVFFGWAVAAVRFGMEFVVPDAAMWFGLYLAMPVALLHCGVTGRLDSLGFGRLCLGMLIVGVLV